MNWGWCELNKGSEVRLAHWWSPGVRGDQVNDAKSISTFKPVRSSGKYVSRVSERERDSVPFFLSTREALIESQTHNRFKRTLVYLEH